LLLIPDISHEDVSHPSGYATPGDTLTVKVIRSGWNKGDFVAPRKELQLKQEEVVG
jgi:hypothetical protein